MNIIEATKRLDEGKKVRLGKWVYRLNVNRCLQDDDGSGELTLHVEDLKSEKWTVIDE